MMFGETVLESLPVMSSSEGQLWGDDVRPGGQDQ